MAGLIRQHELNNSKYGFCSQEHENAPVTFGAEAPKPKPAQTHQESRPDQNQSGSARKNQSHTAAAKHRK